MQGPVLNGRRPQDVQRAPPWATTGYGTQANRAKAKIMKRDGGYDRDDMRADYRTNKRRKTSVMVVTAWPWVHATALNMKNGKRVTCSLDASQCGGIRQARKEAAATALKAVR